MIDIFYLCKLIIVAFTISVFSSFLIYRFGLRIGLIDIPSNRGSHSIAVPRGGGIGILLSFMIIDIYINKDYYLVFYIFAISIFSFVDDHYDIKAKYKFIVHLLISCIVGVYLFGNPMSLLEIMFLVSVTIFLSGTANFYNFMDGINGLAGLSGIISFGLLAIFSFRYNLNIQLGISSIIVAVACFGFLIYNFPKAKIFMGDVGSIFLGFVFGLFVIMLSSSLKIFMCLILFLSTFYADAIVSLYYRWRRGDNLLRAHRMHLYQYLTNENSIPHWKVSLIYTFFQLFIGLLSIVAYDHGLIFQILLFVVYGILFVIVYSRIKSNTLEVIKN